MRVNFCCTLRRIVQFETMQDLSLETFVVGRIDKVLWDRRGDLRTKNVNNGDAYN